MTRIKWTKQDIDYLKANHSQYTSTELADFLGRQVNTVQTKLWQLQLKAKRSNKHNPTITGVPTMPIPKPTHIPRPSQKQAIDESIYLRQAKEEMKQMLHMLDGASVIKGSQAELLETMRALNTGKITPEHAMAALEIGAYLIESVGDSLESAASLTEPVIKNKVEKPSKKPHPWRELDKQTLPEATEPTGVFANVFAPKGGFVPPEIGSVTKVVDGVRK